MSASSSSSSSSSSASLPSSPPGSFPGSFPGWWTRNDDARSREFVKFDRHVAHVVVPEYDGDDGATVATCEDVVRWVLRASSSALDDDVGGGGRSDSPPPGCECDDDDEEAARRSRVRAEWNEGEEEVSSSGGRVILDPSYRHDPALLPRTTTATDGGPPDLVASELLSLGSVWRLPRDAPGSSPWTDRFDPGSGSRPTRLDVGDADDAARPGDYFRVHFDPRR